MTQSPECDHSDNWFDRSICPEPCGMMHTYCTLCGDTLDYCALASSADNWWQRYAVELERRVDELKARLAELEPKPQPTCVYCGGVQRMRIFDPYCCGNCRELANGRHSSPQPQLSGG